MAEITLFQNPENLVPKQIRSPQLINQRQVLDSIQSCDGHLDQNLANMVRLYPNWKYDRADISRLSELDWIFNKDNPKHVSWRLTNNGKSRKVIQVAQKYLSMKSGQLSDWTAADKIERLVSLYDMQKKVPPVVIVPGARYPDSPDSSFIDGVHRTLAAMVYHLKTGRAIELDCYIGSKASIFSRIVKKLY